jgi:hypothetical protein
VIAALYVTLNSSLIVWKFAEFRNGANAEFNFTLAESRYPFVQMRFLHDI